MTSDDDDNIKLSDVIGSMRAPHWDDGDKKSPDRPFYNQHYVDGCADDFELIANRIRHRVTAVIDEWQAVADASRMLGGGEHTFNAAAMDTYVAALRDAIRNI